MSSFDNEIYRGPPEAGPTLERDIRSYGSDVYILKAEKNTLAQDVPPTEEPIRQDAKPIQKKESKIAKAMKLLASCTAAATIAATLVATPLPPVEKPTQTFDEWPGFSQLGDAAHGFSFDICSQNSHIAQASTGNKAYRITAKQKDLHLFWQTTYNTDYDDNREGFCLMMDNWAEDWYVVLDVHTHPQEPWDDSQLLDQITTTSGEALYLRAEFIGGQEQSMDKLQNILDHLSDYIEISEATEDGWGKALIGYTMYSDTNAQWNGIVNTPDVNPGFDFGNIHYRQHANYSEENFIRSLTINDIDWSFYYSFDEYSLWLWAVPSQEDIALGAALDFLVDDMGLSVSDLAKGSPEINTELMDRLGVAVELAAKQCFSNYHLYTGFYDPPVYFPEISPMDPVGPGTGLPPDIQPDNPFTEEYFIGYPFSFEGRNFQMDSLRDDILFRQIYQTHDHAQFDFRVDNEGLRVQLIISVAPNGKDYYPYYLADGTEIFVAAFNYWGEPWIADEVTLSNLAEYLSSYVQITETTELFIPETEPDPYDYLPEYTQYIVDSSGMSYSPFARSNRVCHFSTNGGNYRLASQSPDLFMLWENYYYDMKEESANSYITFNNIADGWSMGVWVFDEPVESVYDSFTLTAGDGTTLWFYIANFDDYSQQNNLDAILMKLPDILFLSRAKDGDWTKVLYGESLIVDVTSSWSGLAYTANNDDFWCFDQMISVNDLQNHNLRFADSRTVNGATWEFYTTGSSNGYGMTAGKEFYSTQVFAVPTGGDICFTASLYNGLSMDQYEFSNQAEYEAYIDANIHPAIDTIVSQGLSNFHFYQSPDNVPSDPADFDTDEEFYLDKSAYDWIGEYSSYDSTPDGVLTHTCYGWSNRTCQLNVNNNAYRLEAMTPEVFICWDNYSYDTESQSGVSQIQIYHLTEAWKLITWVSDNPEHLASADFSLTMEDGTQLWFYVWHHYAPSDPLQDIIQRIENYVKLSPPREDGWNKVRIGKTMISDMNMQWNGRNSTARTGWDIDEILSREAAAEYAPQFIETRTVNGITWNFYHSGPGTVYAVPQQEDIWLKISSGSVLNIDLRQFRNGRELSDYYNANIGIAIDRIINEGLSNYHLYP